MPRRRAVGWIVVLAGVVVAASGAWATLPERVTVTDVTDRQFAVAWVTAAAEVGQVVWGTSPGSLNLTADDVRPDPTGYAHLVRVTGLAPGTTYYFKLVSGGEEYLNGGSPWTVRTGAVLPTPPTPPDARRGVVRVCQGQEAALDVLVFLTVIQAGGDQSVPRAFVVHQVRPVGGGGMFLIDPSNARRAVNVDQVLGYGSGDQLRVVLDGREGRTPPLLLSAAPGDVGTVSYCPLSGCDDGDGDGYGSPGNPGCPGGSQTDCDDGDPTVYPGGPEFCDGKDNDCNQVIDDEPAASQDCLDDLFCNGQEVCAGGACQAGAAPDCGDGVACTTDTCNEETDSCDHAPDDAACDNGLYCDGAEYCDPTHDCQAGTPPVCDDDGLFCTGPEVCDEILDDCVSAGSPCVPGAECDEEADECDGPTAIELVSFEATVVDGDVVLTWETATELDNAGFHLWRTEAESGDYTRITDSLIPAQGDGFTGAEYSFTDGDVKAGKTYWYKLEDVDVYGRSTLHGPVRATVPRRPLFGCGE